MGRRMFGAFLERVGTGDLGETTELPDGRVVRRLGEPRVRELTTVFGRFAVTRCVYGTGERQVFALVPTDSRLQLPAGNVSYLLQEWDQLLGIDQAFSVARDTLNTIIRIKQSVDTLEHGSRQMAESAPAFREQQAAPDPAAEGELLIVTEDNKGVPMVRPPDAPPPGAHLTKGQKKNKKRAPPLRWSACIGAVDSLDRHVRTPEELVQTLFRDEDRPRVTPSKATQKRYWASLSRTVEVRPTPPAARPAGTVQVGHRRSPQSGHAARTRQRGEGQAPHTDRVPGIQPAPHAVRRIPGRRLPDRHRRDRRRLSPSGQTQNETLRPYGTQRQTLENPRSQALLTLRAIRANGDWETFQDFRIPHEPQRLHPTTFQLQSIHFQSIPWPLTPTAISKPHPGTPVTPIPFRCSGCLLPKRR